MFDRNKVVDVEILEMDSNDQGGQPNIHFHSFQPLKPINTGFMPVNLHYI